MYERMIEVAEKYPNFVAPLTRESPEAEKTEAYEFYFLQWAFHGPPPPPSLALDDPFHVPRIPHAADYPPISTILFTPLQEYKLRESFATPYLVLTHYTDFARTHGIVLLRGEVTPGASGAGHLLSQADAQLLALAIQKFYLWGPKGGDEAEGERLVRIFHQRPQEFKWEELLKHANLN
jgi:ATP synthase F1 complex assembly factor 1